MYNIGAVGHPCIAERDIGKTNLMKPFVFISFQSTSRSI
jgi:hypothetical protein